MKIDEVVILDDAARDMVDGKIFYEQQETGIDDYFWDSILSDIESLSIYAGIHQRYYGLYRMLSKRFPYAIYYEVIEQTAYVLAILPMRKNPAWTRDKVHGRR